MFCFNANLSNIHALAQMQTHTHIRPYTQRCRYAPVHWQPRARNQSQHLCIVHHSEQNVRPDRYHQSHAAWQQLRCEQNRAHFTWDMSSSFYGAGPHRTQGYPLSPGEIITPRRGDKSTEPGPYSPSITANLFIGILMFTAHGCCHNGARRAFSDLPTLHNWLFSTFTTLKYAWQLPWRCPAVHHMRWFVAYHNRVTVHQNTNYARISQSCCNIHRSLTLALFPCIEMLNRQNKKRSAKHLTQDWVSCELRCILRCSVRSGVPLLRSTVITLEKKDDFKGVYWII